MISKDAAAITLDILIFCPFSSYNYATVAQQTETAHHEGLATPTKPYLDSDSDFRHQAQPDYTRGFPQLGLGFEKP
jgi:hypothetical protein